MYKGKSKFFKKRFIKRNRINKEIVAEKVRLVSENGTEVVTLEQALEKARSQDEDLVEIVKDQVPVVKIIDYGKFKFERAKKEKKKKQKTIHLKEIKMSPKIDTGDFDRKCSMAKNFLHVGDNVKVSMRFRGREMAHTELGMEKMDEFYKALAEDSILEKKPALERRTITMILRSTGQKKE